MNGEQSRVNRVSRPIHTRKRARSVDSTRDTWDNEYVRNTTHRSTVTGAVKATGWTLALVWGVLLIVSTASLVFCAGIVWLAFEGARMTLHALGLS